MCGQDLKDVHDLSLSLSVHVFKNNFILFPSMLNLLQCCRSILHVVPTTYLSTSVTRWLVYLFKIWQFTSLQICQIGKTSNQSRCQNLPNSKVNPHKTAKSFQNFARVVKFRQIWSHCYLPTQECIFASSHFDAFASLLLVSWLSNNYADESLQRIQQPLSSSVTVQYSWIDFYFFKN